jgi:proteasome lid subunit RPN8/RPN11
VIKDILFANPWLEERFRETVAGKYEKGGWLFVSAHPWLWQSSKPYADQAFTDATGIDPYFVNGFLLAPNEVEKKKETSYRPWDWKKADELAHVSARAINCFAVDFHSHPGGPKDPSPNDIALAAQFSSFGDETAWFVIATTYPLRLWPFELKWSRNKPSSSRLTHGKFTSWRGGLLKPFK